MAKKKNKSAKNLSHEEIWDDTALVRSWDEAVQEYTLYHSIHARGENVEDVLNRAEKEGIEAVAANIPKSQESMDVEDELGDALVEEKQDKSLNAGVRQNLTESWSTGGVFTSPAAGEGPNVPDALLGQAQDPALKNLMMSWYYAGYYTGLYEGRQQASQNSDPNTRP